MAEVTLDVVPQKVRDFFNKGFAALEHGRLEYAMDMLSHCLEEEPALLQARKFLRAAEIQKYKKEKTTAIARILSLVSSFPAFIPAIIAVKSGKGAKALAATDKLLRNNPLERRYMKLFADAAELAALPEAAVQILEIAREHYPDDGPVLECLGRHYQLARQNKKAIECFEKLCEMNPNNPAAIKAMKDAMALDSLEGDGWAEASEEGKSYRDLIKDTGEATRLEQESKAVKTNKDVDDLIADTIKKIEAEPDNINYYRALARYYGQKGEFDDAVATLTKALKMAPGDPELEQALSDLKVGRFNADIEALKADGREEEALAKETERAQFVFDSLQERVKRYPNDLNLRYEFGVMLYENDYVNEAIQQFQMSQRNPKLRADSLYHLAMCFKHKEQYDLAFSELEKAASDLTRMDKTKKDICYALGELSELMGKREQAADYFKQIYQVDIQYRDIAEKIEQVYNKGS